MCVIVASVMYEIDKSCEREAGSVREKFWASDNSEIFGERLWWWLMVGDWGIFELMIVCEFESEWIWNIWWGR